MNRMLFIVWGAALFVHPLHLTLNASAITAYTCKSYKLCLMQQGSSIWMGTTGGVIRWDMRTGGFDEYTTGLGLAGNHIRKGIIDNNDNVWFTSDGGVSMFDVARWHGFVEMELGLGTIASIDERLVTFTARDENGWIAIRYEGLVRHPTCAADYLVCWKDAMGKKWKLLPFTQEFSLSAPTRFTVTDGHGNRVYDHPRPNRRAMVY